MPKNGVFGVQLNLQTIHRKIVALYVFVSIYIYIYKYTATYIYIYIQLHIYIYIHRVYVGFGVVRSRMVCRRCSALGRPETGFRGLGLRGIGFRV